MDDNRKSKELFVESLGFLTLKSWYSVKNDYFGIDIYSDEVFLGEVPGLSLDDTNEHLEKEILKWSDTFK